MKKSLGYLLASLLVLFVAMPAFAEIEWSGNIMAGIEKMDYGTPTLPGNDESDNLQFSNIKLNLDVKADVCEGVVGVAQLRAVSSSPGVTKRLVYMEISDPLIPASIQIGRIQLPLGAELAKISEGANTMNNPLIFNSILADVMGDQAVDDGLLISKTLGPVNCKLGITNGYDSEDKQEGLQPKCKDTNSDKALTLNLSGACPVVPGLTVGGTYYTNDAADSSGETDEIDKWIIDVAYTSGLLKLAAAIGNEEEKYDKSYSGHNTVETADIDYLVLEAVYGNGETPWWVAARYSKDDPSLSISPAIPGVTVKGSEQKRLELGLGYKVCENAYLKVEYIDSELKDNIKDLDDKDGIKAIVNVRF